MLKLKVILKKNGLLLATAFSFMLFLTHNQFVFRTDFSYDIENYQQKFRKKVVKLDTFLAYKNKHFSEEKISI